MIWEINSRFLLSFEKLVATNMINSLPYKVEYAVGEQDCKKCDKKIRSGILKIAIMMQVGEININVHMTYFVSLFFALSS